MRNKILFFSYWYPNKNSRIFPVFVKKHAQCVSIENDIVVLSFHVIDGPSFFKKSTEVIVDEHGIETHQIYIESKFYKILYNILPLHYLILKKYISKIIYPNYKFDIIHSNILFPCAISGHQLSAYFKSKHVITEHWSKLNQFFRKNLYKYSGKNAYDKANAITCVSGILKNTVQSYSHNRSITVVPNVIDETEFYHDPRAEEHKLYTFVAAANWTSPKNPFLFLDAMERLYREGKIPELSLCFIGNGQQLEDVKQKGYSYPITYTGILNAEQLRKHLNASQRFVHGSNYETFSTIIVEALLCGLPSVVSPVGIAPETINEANGYITDNTPEDWYQKLYACYQGSYNPKTISEQLIGKYDLQTVGSYFSNIYRTL